VFDFKQNTHKKYGFLPGAKHVAKHTKVIMDKDK